MRAPRRLFVPSSLAPSNMGRIVLQVENNGEAWYINPADLKRYYLGRPQDAFDIMTSTFKRDISVSKRVKQELDELVNNLYNM